MMTVFVIPDGKGIVRFGQSGRRMNNIILQLNMEVIHELPQ